MAAYSRPTKLGGPGKYVQVDEVFIRHVRVPGTGHCDAVKVMGISCNGKLITGIIADRTRSTLHRHINRWVAPGSIIITDDWAAYRGLERLGYEHVSVNHSKGFFNQQGHSTCEIDSYWATLRRCMRGYHQVAAENLWLFIAEIECRYNWRQDRTGLFEHLISHWPALTPENRNRLEQGFDWRLSGQADFIPSSGRAAGRNAAAPK
jgi:transposase-like protein